MKDLIVLTACKNAQYALLGILSRKESLNIRSLSVDPFVHAERDPGCAKAGVDLLRSQVKRYRHALLVFDYEGSGLSESVDDATTRLKDSLAASGWGDRADVILIAPELETWVWSDSPQVDQVLGWGDSIVPLRRWLLDQCWIESTDQIKPARPKEAMEAALQESRVTRSSSLYRELASKVGLHRCNDPAFVRLKTTLRGWFEPTD